VGISIGGEEVGIAWRAFMGTVGMRCSIVEPAQKLESPGRRIEAGDQKAEEYHVDKDLD